MMMPVKMRTWFRGAASGSAMHKSIHLVASSSGRVQAQHAPEPFFEQLAIECQSLTKIFWVNGRPVRALSQVCVQIREAEFVAILGRSGAGKTTLLNLLGGFDRPTEGSLEVLGMDLAGSTPARISNWRRHNLSCIFQDRCLVGGLSVAENVDLPLRLEKLGREDRRGRVMDALSLTGMESRARAFPCGLSRSECLRVIAARAIVSRPRLILADQIDNTDPATSAEMLGLLKRMNRQFGTTVVLFTQDDRSAAIAHRVSQLECGRFSPAARWA